MEGRTLPSTSVFVKCSYCDKDFTTVSHKRRHEANIHGISPIREHMSERTGAGVGSALSLGLICDICDKTFSNSANKKKHVKNIHGIYEPPSASDLSCDICAQTFSRLSSKRRHVKEVHELPRTSCSKPTVVMCKECDVHFGTLRSYRHHLLQSHNVTTNSVNYEFGSEEEFMAWKGGLEMDVGVSYTTQSGSWKSADGIKTIYYCQRSGVKRSALDADNKRAGKSQGTSKIGYFCTSSLEVVKCDGCVQVTYYMDHRDHDTDFPSLVHLKLPTSENRRPPRT
ncbi:hypothetical protein SK128_025128 [Halocaridina rubra]|uniref:C2H2-type domain-containing protein n=1 Tax=Halocaridina rubra TaxID=373956 RepID=A0AAN8WXY0_HALRR